MNRESNFFDFFVPLGTGPLGVEDAAATAAVHGEYLCIRKCKVKRFMFGLTIACIATSTAPIVKAWRRPTLGSASAEVAIATLTIPDTTAIGKVLYKKFAPVAFKPGEGLCFEHTQVCVGGSIACSGHYAMECEDSPEEPANESNMVLSA